MVSVTLWLLLLLVALMLMALLLRQSDQCSKLQEEKSRLERDRVSITELQHKNELRGGNCDMSSYIKICSFYKLLVLLSNTCVTVS
jgi:hypothetical protein